MSKTIWLILGGVIVMGLVFANRIPLRPLVQMSEKIIDLQVGRTKNWIAAPSSERAIFLLGAPKSMSALSISGEMRLLKGTNLLVVPLRSENLTPCNWLDGKGVDGAIIEIPERAHKHSVSFFLTPGERIQMEVTITNVTQVLRSGYLLPPQQSCFRSRRAPSNPNTVSRS